MPAYTFFCESCNKKYEVVSSIKDYHDRLPCDSCGSGKSVYRLYTEDAATLNTSVRKSDDELKTIGDLANRNRDRLSEDQKTQLYNKHNSYKDQESVKELPKGMSRIKKPEKIKWIKK